MEEEQKLEQEALAKIDPEVIKAEIVAETGLDEVDNADVIEKMVAREVKTREIASKAIGSKIKTRTELDELKKNPPKIEKKVEADEVEKTVSAALEKRDLEALDYPDDLKAEIKKVASTQGVSIRQALSDPYVKFKTDAYQKEKDATEAGISRTNRTSGSQKFDFNNPPDVDVSTEEGRAEWEKWKEQAKKAGN